MQFIIDHLAATVIGATILLAVLALGHRSQESAIEAAKIDFGKAEMRQLIDVVEQDFINLGSGLADPDAAITFYATNSGYDEIRFSSLENDTGTPDPISITYRWRQQGTATLPDGSTVDTYELERSTAASTVTFDDLTNFSVTLRKKKLVPVSLGAPADSVALAEYVDVDIGMLAPFGADDLLQQSRWSKRFRPINLDPNKQLIAAKPPGL